MEDSEAGTSISALICEAKKNNVGEQNSVIKERVAQGLPESIHCTKHW
jgi:hypothetical protein